MDLTFSFARAMYSRTGSSFVYRGTDGRNAERQHMGRVEARAHIDQPEQTSHQETCAEKKR